MQAASRLIALDDDDGDDDDDDEDEDAAKVAVCVANFCAKYAAVDNDEGDSGTIPSMLQERRVSGALLPLLTAPSLQISNWDRERGGRGENIVSW